MTRHPPPANVLSLDDVNARARALRLVIFDVDGVLTDGALYLADDGQEMKAFFSLDGHGMKMLKRSGVELAIITARNSQLMVHRARNLGITHLYQGAEDKLTAYQHLLQELDIPPESIAYMGDDVVDLPVMRRCGLAITVPGAPEIVKQYAHYITTLPGGRGAVREVCELIMRAQGTWETQLAPYLK
ncbi:MAG: 3-deoxy-manno-octulosonate-8-phosphatase KdsC [Burkholderiales bacterium]|nr:3-deoxy-manno-octulosonate-8-phosphatase KdsC [Burkholderiales bacterium]